MINDRIEKPSLKIIMCSSGIKMKILLTVMKYTLIGRLYKLE